MTTHGFGDLGDELARITSDHIHEAAAEKVAEMLRAQGLDSADGVALDIPTDDPTFKLDVERVRSMANEILASE
jgi:hypothetical protein